MMELNADFKQEVIVRSHSLDWVASPMPGVDRRMLDRIGEEVARATSIVRYAPDSKFSPHTHSGGEEFIVLEGVFQDEHGDYPAGTYVRNPPTTSHTPGAKEGCVIFVKLWQFDPEDRTQFRKQMSEEVSEPVDGVSSAILHEDIRETVVYAEMDAGAELSNECAGGLELLVLDGSIGYGEDILTKGDWIRLPDGASFSCVGRIGGAKLWFKTGHLRFAKAPDV